MLLYLLRANVKGGFGVGAGSKWKAKYPVTTA